ncbi:LTE1_2 [Sanghuangporus weigelae]
MAATIERWIAQLTSQFDYDELLIFFLSYRTYIDALDLCHLLICRFHWALEEPMSPQEVMVKQIVRVRTFVAIRYWLLTFFRIDFLPNREPCLPFADWLNTLWRDSILDKYNDARNIVGKLKKVAKDCKAHSRVDKSNRKAEKKIVVIIKKETTMDVFEIEGPVYSSTPPAVLKLKLNGIEIGTKQNVTYMVYTVLEVPPATANQSDPVRVDSARALEI